MSCRLVALEMAGFRGFRDPQRLDLDADIILVRGDNGTGKTSLTDGILWVLTGELPHISERIKGARQTHDPLQNRYSDGPPRVALTIRDATSTWVFERTGSARSNELTATRDGAAVDAAESLPHLFGESSFSALVLAITTWGVLRQDAVRSVLDTGGAALHERMASVIGLSEVTRFQDACKASTKRASNARSQARGEMDRAKSALEASRAALQSSNSKVSDDDGDLITDRLSAALMAVRNELAVDVSGVETIDEVVSLGQQVGSLFEFSTAAADAYDVYVRAAASVVDASDQLTQELELAERRAVDLSRAASETQRLAEVAIGMLGDACPVCDQPIDQRRVLQKLQADLDRSSQRLVEATEARSLTEAIRRRLDTAKSNEAHRSAVLDALEARKRNLQDGLSGTRRVHLRAPQLEDGSLRLIARRLEELRGELRRLHNDLRARADVTEARLGANVTAAEGEFSRAEAALRLVTANEKLAKLIEDQTQAAADRIVANWLRALEPSFAEVFDRLSPHPTFSVLRARQDVYYRKNQIVPEVVDPLREVTANPLLVYSEGQLNTVAISYFLGLALNAPTSGVGFMVMDDPLQSMDVVAVLGFADLCRRLRRERQLIITTHDRRYADLLGRKLAPREPGDRTITHEFENWSDVGPQVTTLRNEFAETTTLLSGHASG
jgi:hypothetical protein